MTLSIMSRSGVYARELTPVLPLLLLVHVDATRLRIRQHGVSRHLLAVHTTSAP